MDTFTGSAGSTAYFWNDQAGTDTIAFGSAISSASGVGAFFGFTSGVGTSNLHVSFATGQGTATFGATGLSSQFAVGAGNTLVSFGFGSTQTTILFASGNMVTLQGGAFEGATGTNIFSNVGAGTANFGIASVVPTFS